jgi:hypothetical protein
MLNHVLLPGPNDFTPLADLVDPLMFRRLQALTAEIAAGGLTDPATRADRLAWLLSQAAFEPWLPVIVTVEPHNPAAVAGADSIGDSGTADDARDLAATHFAAGADSGEDYAAARSALILRLDLTAAPHFCAILPADFVLPPPAPGLS